MRGLIFNLQDDRILIPSGIELRQLREIKQIKGRRKPSMKQPHWTVPAELIAARQLRQIFGQQMKLSPALRARLMDQREQERNLRRLHSATDATLQHIPKGIERAIKGEAMPNFPFPFNKERPERPYQRADIAMMAASSAINANQVGTGKTLETVAAIYEAGLNGRPVLVLAPLRTLVNTWQKHFEIWTDYSRVYTSEDPTQRKQMWQGLMNYLQLEPDFSDWVLGLIYRDILLEKYVDAKATEVPTPDPLHACRDYKGNWYRFRSEAQRQLYQIHWGAVIIDEFHRSGLNNRNSLFHVSASLLIADRKWCDSGTPIGGKPRRLWPVLHYLYPKVYTSEWRWISDWLEVEEQEFYKGGKKQTSKTVGGIRADREEQFYEHHRKHMVRRLKRDALPGLPVAVEILVDTPMLPAQRRAYREFDLNSEVLLATGQRISASGVLAIYTRLRQFASTVGDVTGKLEPLLENLDENGIRQLDYEPGARAYVGCIQKDMVHRIVKALNLKGIAANSLTGDTKDSKPVIDTFNDTTGHPEPFVIVMTMQTGGVGLDLEPAGSAHLIDETWDPDETEQFFGRGDRGSRDTPLRCYIYRTPDSIQDYIAQVCEDKALNNRTVMKYAPQIERLRRRRR